MAVFNDSGNQNCYSCIQHTFLSLYKQDIFRSQLTLVREMHPVCFKYGIKRS